MTLAAVGHNDDFRKQLVPHAYKLYRELFPGCKVHDLREDGKSLHTLDAHFGIDTLIWLKCGTQLSLQEKYRRYDAFVNLKLRVDKDWPDFTQEFKDAVGTEHEKPGEWPRLGADLYFQGWAKKDGSGFEAWILLNTPNYKLIVEQAGGLDEVGKLMHNYRHGRSSFYCIPVYRLQAAAMSSYNIFT